MQDGLVLRLLLESRIRVRHSLKRFDKVYIAHVAEIVGHDNPDQSKDYEVDYEVTTDGITFTNDAETFAIALDEYELFEKAYLTETARQDFRDTRYTLGDKAPEPDMVNSPDHYKKRYSREVIQSIKGLCTPEEYRGYLKGSKIKYLARYQDKGGIEDLEKGQWYGAELIAFEKEQTNKTQEATQ